MQAGLPETGPRVSDKPAHTPAGAGERSKSRYNFPSVPGSQTLEDRGLDAVRDELHGTIHESRIDPTGMITTRRHHTVAVAAGVTGART